MIICFWKYKLFQFEFGTILGLEFVALLAGLALLFSYTVFTNRYMATLSENAIHYKNLLGQTGVINLKDIVKLEQKRNLLSLIRTFAFLGFYKKTGIAFIDENLDEYEINIYTKLFQANSIFDSIIDNANKCGNLKIRQYTI